MLDLNRRGFLGVLAGAIAAPIIVKAANIMPVRKVLIVPPRPPIIVHTNVMAVARDPLKQVYRLYRNGGEFYEVPISVVSDGHVLIPGYLGHAKDGDFNLDAIYIDHARNMSDMRLIKAT